MGMFDANGPGTKFRFTNADWNPSDVQSFGYYCGAQITIWWGDIWVDDVTSIAWDYRQEKRPIYGYNSQYFDAVAKGQILIQGQFRINFREKGYLSYIMDKLPTIQKTALGSSYKSGSAYTTTQDTQNTWTALRPIISQHLRKGTFGPSTYSQIAALAENPNFWEISTAYESAIWGEAPEEDIQKRKTPDQAQWDVMPNGFNILITYGNPQAQEPTSINDVMESTSKSLIGVHLLGSSQVIEINGEPVQEVYTFMARDMDKYIGTAF